MAQELRDRGYVTLADVLSHDREWYVPTRRIVLRQRTLVSLRGHGLSERLLEHIGEWSLSVRTARSLLALDAVYLGELCAMTAADLQREGFDRESVGELTEIIGLVDVHLGQDLPAEVRACFAALRALPRTAAR